MNPGPQNHRDDEKSPESKRRQPGPSDLKALPETKILTDELRSKLLRAGMPQTVLKKGEVATVLSADGASFLDLKIIDVNTLSGEVTVRSKSGRDYIYPSMEALLELVEDAKSAEIAIRDNQEKLRQLPASFSLYITGTLFENLRLKSIDYRTGEVIVSSIDGRLEWKPMPIDKLIYGIKKTDAWKIQQEALAKQKPLSPAAEALTAPDRNKQQLSPELVARKTEVLSVGDLHGNYQALIDNLTALKLIDSEHNWIGKNRTVVLHGDILADRNTDSLRIMKKIRDLQVRAEGHGGKIIVLAGNHEDFASSFLAGIPTADNKEALFQYCLNFGQGLLELWRDYLDGNINPEKGFMTALNIISDKQIQPEDIHKMLLANMQKSQQGKLLLEQMTQMKIAEQINDALYLHTEPTPAIIELLLRYKSIGEAVDNINAIYRQGLKCHLLGEGKLPRDFDLIREIFLSTENRTEGRYNQKQLLELNRRGINFIFHGHTHTNLNNSVVSAGGVNIVGVDHSYGKTKTAKAGDRYGETEISISASGISKKGQIYKIKNPNE